jgi:hypothetical protein
MCPRSNIRPHPSKAKERIIWVGTIDMTQKGATVSSTRGIKGVDARGKTKST